jgi:hypothetical protein
VAGGQAAPLIRDLPAAKLIDTLVTETRHRLLDALAPAAYHRNGPDRAPGRIPEAGSVAGPGVDAEPESIRELTYSIIRVLNREGDAVGPWAGLLTDEQLLTGLRDMMTLRTFDARMLMAQRQAAPAAIPHMLHIKGSLALPIYLLVPQCFVPTAPIK